MNSKICECLPYLWVSQEKRWKTSQGFSPDKAGGLGSVLASKEAKTQSVLHIGRITGSMMRSKLTVTIWEEESSNTRDVRVQISTLYVQLPPDKQRKFEEEWD